MTVNESNTDQAPPTEGQAGRPDGSDQDLNLEAIMDVPVNLSLEVGRTRMSIRNLLQLSQGSVVELQRMVGDPLDVYVNGTLIARAEVVEIDGQMGARLTEVVSKSERIKRLSN